jgi:hypothetical protein
MNCIGIGSFLLTIGQFLSSIQSLLETREHFMFDIEDESKKSEIFNKIADYYSGEKEGKKVSHWLLGWTSYIFYGLGIIVLIVLSNLPTKVIGDEKIGFIFTAITISTFFFSMAIENYKQYKLQKESDMLYMKSLIFALDEYGDEFRKKENIEKLASDYANSLKKLNNMVEDQQILK